MENDNINETNKCKSLSEKIEELKEKKRKLLIEKNNKIDKNYKVKKSYPTKQIYIGFINDINVPKGIVPNPSGLYLFNKIFTDYYEEYNYKGERYLDGHFVEIYEEIFTGVKYYPYGNHLFRFEPNKVNIVSNLKDAISVFSLSVPKNIKKEELVSVLNKVIEYKREILEYSGEIKAQIK